MFVPSFFFKLIRTERIRRIQILHLSCSPIKSIEGTEQWKIGVATWIDILRWINHHAAINVSAEKINDGRMLYSDSIRNVRKAAQLYNRWIYLSTTKRLRKRNRIELSLRCATIFHETDTLKCQRTGGKKIREKSREICLPDSRAIDFSREFFARNSFELCDPFWI